MDVISLVEKKYLKSDVPDFRSGDTVRVHVKVKEGARERIQVFEGVVIARKHGGLSETFTVGNGANYGQALACTGNATALAGNLLTVNAADTAIVCTFTNSYVAPLAITKTSAA